MKIQERNGKHIWQQRKEILYNEIKNKFENELLLEKGKEAVFDLQDDLEDLLASGSTFSEISETLDVQLIKANKINRKGIDSLYILCIDFA